MIKGSQKLMPLVLIIFACFLVFTPAAMASSLLWDVQTVDTDGVVGEFTSIAVDSANNPHISYYDASSGNLKYASWDGTEWDIQTVDEIDNVGYTTSLAMDSQDRPHISYYDRTNQDLRYASWNGAGWSIQTVDASGSVGAYSSIALDADDLPHISYYDSTNTMIKYAALSGGFWDIQTVDSSFSPGSYSSIEIDSSGYPVISYGGTGEALKLARWDGSGWQIMTVAGVGQYGMYTSLALDAEDVPHVTYCDRSSRQIVYAEWNGSGWDKQVIGSANIGSNSITLDVNGNPHVAYDCAQGVRYDYWDGNTWVHNNVTNDVGWDYVSLALDADSNVHISAWGDSVWSSGNPVLKYVFGLWQSSNVDLASVTVKGVSAAADSENDKVYNVELPAGTILADLVSSDIAVTAADANATVGAATTSDGGATWEVTVTAEDGMTSATYTIQVTVAAPISVTGITLDPEVVSLTVGSQMQINAIISPPDSTNTTVSWSTDNARVATVDEDGIIKAIKVGKALITATTEDGGFQATCAVRVVAATTTPSTISISPAKLPTAFLGKDYLVTFTAVGGIGPYGFSYSGDLPAGLDLSPGGLLSGIPTLAGTYSFTINVTDANGDYASKAYALTVKAARK